MMLELVESGMMAAMAVMLEQGDSGMVATGVLGSGVVVTLTVTMEVGVEERRSLFGC